MNNLYNHLKSARLMNGLSLQGLADKIENRVTKKSLGKYEQGQVVPDNTMIGIFSDALQVRADYFYTSTAVEFGEKEFRKLQDYPPKERVRRLVAIILMTTEVGLFGTFTVFVASRFVKEYYLILSHKPQSCHQSSPNPGNSPGYSV